MITVSIKNEYAEILSNFGNLEEAMELAIKRYTLEQITSKIAELKRKSADYQNKYQIDYQTFCQKIEQDETFINVIETNIDKLWEIDLSDWEFCEEGIKDWTNKLQSNL
jgi:hypothetical protein